MELRKPARNEMVLLGLIALLLATIALLPWQQFAKLNSDMQNSKYGFVNLRRGAPARKPELWRADAEYSPASGTLLVRLSNRYDEPQEGLSLYADFSTGPARAPSGAALLHGGSDGLFHTGNLRLGRGDWVIGLTGTRRSEFVFRIEKPLTVD